MKFRKPEADQVWTAVEVVGFVLTVCALQRIVGTTWCCFLAGLSMLGLSYERARRMAARKGDSE